MARVRPFSGLRFDPGRIALGDVIAPPYDVISPKLQEQLYSRAMQNIVRVELGRSYDSDLEGERDRYTRARDHLKVWREQGFLLRDPAPSLYLHRHTFSAPDGSGERIRLGCFAAVEPVPHERREVLRHELTLSKAREDRLQLLLATGVQTSPIFLLYENSAQVTAAMRAQTELGPELAGAVVDGDYGAERHQLWRVSDGEAISAITEGLSRARLFIADGHHRYETALGLHLPGVLALLSPLDDPANTILPTHRLLPVSRLNADELMTALVGVGWEVERVDGVAAGLRRIGELVTTNHAFVILDSGTKWVVARRRQASYRDGAGAPLDVAVLDREILEAQLGVDGSASESGRLRYSRDAKEVEQLVETRGALGLLLNATTVQEMAIAAAAGEAMPQKSTYFFPKVPAGLILMPNQ